MAREAVDRPLAGERQHRPARLLGVLLASVVDDVLAEPFLAGSSSRITVVLRVNSGEMTYAWPSRS